MRKRVYCEMAFWDGFVQSYPSTTPLPTSNEVQKFSTWVNFYSFISRSSIVFDCTKNEFTDKIQGASSSPISADCLRKLFKKHANGEIKISWSENFVHLGKTPLKKMKDVDFCSVYLTINHSSAAEDFGVINITPLDFTKYDFLFKDNGTSVAKDEIGNWSLLLKDRANHNCNSMIIADSYILKKHTVKPNLYKILDLLLPQRLGIPFHFTIVSTDKEIEWKWDKAIETLEKKLIEIRPKLEIQFDGIRVEGREEEIHDRTIITNNIWIGCGAGFDLFRYNNEQKLIAGKSTTVNIVYPFIQLFNDWADDAYLINLEDIDYADSQETCRNRLLNLIKKETKEI